VPVEEQVVAIFAGTTGLVDDLAVEDIRPFELALVQHLRADHADLLEHIRTTREMPDVGELEAAIREYIAVHNEDPKPFVWTRTADQILDSIARYAQRTAAVQPA